MAPLLRAFALTMTVLTACQACAVAAGPGANAHGSVLLLKNSRVLRGHITPTGDSYLVAIDQRNEVRVPAAQVQMHCSDIQEAYSKQRAALPPDKVDPHLELAEWCLREELLAEAGEQLDAAASIQPGHPRLEYMRLRLQLAQQPRPEADITPRRGAAPADEVSEVVQALPADAVAQFATTIQPLLLNRCGAAACHGPASETTFRLLRPSWAKSLPQRLTHRNLHATVQLVDRDQPESSPLIRICREPHGPATTPLFNDPEDYRWRQLTSWIGQLGRRSPNPPPVAFVPPNTILSRTLPHVVGRLPKPDEQPEASEPVEPADQPEPSSVAPSPAVFQPRDPFDPEIFNRRFFAP